jgi:hypothetical protein
MKSNNRGIKASMESEDFILRFDSESDDFARGFACGEVWACLVDEVAEVHCIVTTDNIEMIMRMAEAADYSFEARDLTPEELNLLESEESESHEWLIVVMRSNNEE